MEILSFLESWNVKIILSTILTTIQWLLGGWNTSLQILLIMIILDYITGILKAIINKKLSSDLGAKGIIKKVGYLIIVIIANFLDQIIGSNGTIYIVVIYFFVANEGISIIENWSSMGLPIPNVIKNTLKQIKEKDNEVEAKKNE